MSGRLVFDRSGTPLVALALSSGDRVGLSWLGGLAVRPRFERLCTGDWSVSAIGWCLWRHCYTPPQTVGERGAW